MKYHIEKNTVQETLVIPLFGRLICSEHFPELFSDPEAKRICDSLDYDFAEKRKKMESAAGLFGALEVAQRQYDLACEVRDYLEEHPIIDIRRTAQVLGISYNTATSAVLRLVSLGILQETTGGARNRIFVYQEYLDILREGT